MTEREGGWVDADLYEPYIGRWSRMAAQAFVEWMAVPGGRRWLDVGCGTGALSSAILERANPLAIRGADESALLVAFARERVFDDRVRFDVADALALPYDPATYDAVVSGLMLELVRDPCALLREMARVARPRGCVAAYVWDYAGEMQMVRYFWEAAVALKPAARAFDEGQRFTLCQPAPLRQVFEQAGLMQIESSSIDIPTVFRDFEDYWTPFLGGHGIAPGYAMSLSERDRAALRDRLRATLPIAPDGSIRLHARVWTIRAFKPRDPLTLPDPVV
ncbi:MAG TPA: class I SAM-dependent methyltransferase [Roseiflexaceae bacterium]|nr:class I SAM-dependent methyltransferase [Roseiflexaceae bacterium]